MRLPDRVADWPPDAREWFEERAGIMQFSGMMNRPEAELRAEERARATWRRRTHTGTQGGLAQSLRDR